MATYIFSDVHGHAEPLRRLLNRIAPSDDDRFFCLGDMVDRGPAPLDVVELVRTLPNVTALMGNHEDLMLGWIHDQSNYMSLADWTLNGDIMFYNELLDCAFEISSMGVRVSPESLRRQLKLAGCEERAELPFHKALLDGRLPFTMGGGIGQSRMCMLLLGKAHIGEVQSSFWDEETKAVCRKAGITLL